MEKEEVKACLDIVKILERVCNDTFETLGMLEVIKHGILSQSSKKALKEMLK